MRWRSALAAVLTVVTLVACGSTDSGVEAGAAQQLHAQVDAIRFAAAIGDRRGAAQGTAQLERIIATLRADGRLTEAAASRIRRAAASVRNRLDLLPAPTTTTTTTTTLPDDEKGNGKGNGEGKSKHDDD